MIATLTLLLLNVIEEDDSDTTELDELLDELIELRLLTEEILLIEETLETGTELLLATSPQFFRKVHELSLPGILCVHQFAL